MANRITTHVLKNSDIVNRPLPSTLLKGEPIVNTADGIVYFSGVTTSTNEWTPAGTGTTANFFEVGSNLYDLRLRNKIQSYNGLTNLSGKFLSGTTSGFVLADIASIVGVDTYVTGFTYSNNQITLSQTISGPTLSVLINTMSGLTVNGIFSATTINGGTANLSTINATAGTINTLSSTTINGGNLNLTGGIQSYSGGTNLAGQFLSGTTNGFVLGAISAITGVDTFTTGFTYTSASNTLTINRNQGQPSLTAQINTVSGLTVSNLTAGRVVYVGTGGLLTDEAGFTYDAGTNTFSVPADGTVNVGTGGLNVAGSAVIQGSLTVFGPSISAFTTELYVEDPNITLNYNPTGSTAATSIGAGWTLQNGNGLTAVTVNDVHFNINRLDSLTGLTAGNTPSVTEYTASTGFANRGWITELNDIVIRSTDVTIPNGVRVLAEFDILDGGTF
jgi:hypothetical protein